MSNLLTVQQVSERLGCKSDLVRAHINAKRLRAFNIGAKRQKIWRIAENDLAAFLESQVEEPAEKIVRRPPLELKYLKGCVG